MHKPSVAKTPTVKTASIMLPSTESGLPLDGRKPKYSQSRAVQVTIITVDQKFVRALPLSHSSAPRQALCSPCRTGRPFGSQPGTKVKHHHPASLPVRRPCRCRVREWGRGKVWGTKAKPLAAYRRRLCCLAASYITAAHLKISLENQNRSRLYSAFQQTKIFGR
jgi:hypothetical protein